jgi:hypothetical protein
MPFEKGKSGNPGGRPKEEPEVKKLAKSFTAEAIKRLAYWMRSDNPKASPAAATTLLNRAWGTPTQAVELTGKDGGPIETVTNETDVARAIAFTLERGLKAKPTEH